MTMTQHDNLNYAEDPFVPELLPTPAPAASGIVHVEKGHLWYFDTGGEGEAIVLLHPAAGSGLVWGYQQPVFAKAGYRVIGYSRRGYCGSSALDESDPGSAVDDMQALLDALGVGRFHLLGVAAGGWVAADYALACPEQILTLTVAGNPLGQNRGTIAELQRSVRPRAWDALPPWFRELSPGYCAANPVGVQKWVELNALSLVNPEHHKDLMRTIQRQKAQDGIGPDSLARLKMPVLLLGGAADVYSPPSTIRMTARLVPHCEWMIASEAGHSLYWERPELFNRVVLDFLGRNKTR